MKTITSTGKKLHIPLFFMGLLAILFMALPYVILGKDAIVTYHDQLDGELIAYLLQARHLFDNGMIPEFMGGAAKTALTPPAPASVLLFLGGDGFVGLLLMQLLGSLCGYLGMYLLVKQETKEAAIGVVMGVLYGYLPFLPVYGLAQYGLPLLLFCILEAKEGRRQWAAFCYAALFALNSSLVLVGFAVLGTMALWMLLSFLQKEERTGLKRCFLLWLMMLGIYVTENLGLLVQALGGGRLQGENGISHKAEYRLLPESVPGSFLTGFLQGGQHSADSHGVFLWAVAVLAVFVLAWLWHGRKVGKKGHSTVGFESAGQILPLLRVMGICLSLNVFFALVAALWNGSLGIFARSRLQALGAFQMERFLWLAPCFWYLMFGCSLAMVKKLWKIELFDKKMVQGGIRMVLTACMAVALCMAGGKVLLSGNLKPNLQKLKNPDYEAISFRDYYAIDVLCQVEAFLEEASGCAQEEYRVVSLGIDPAAALYHGFYCLDGYSNNYSLAYKHTFRRALEPELDKSGYLTDYFDNWGNRCYLFSAECPGYYTIEKGGFAFQDYELNADVLREMGGRYLFSAAYIVNAGEQGLTLLREEAFETEDSYYRIFVYEF